MGDRIHLTYDGPVATITNDNPGAHNAFDDAMDLELFEAFSELRDRPDVRAIIWRGEGKSFSSGRDVSSIGNLKVELTHHELMRRGHRGIQQIWQIAGHGLVSDMVLTGRVLSAEEALRHGIVSRVVPADDLDSTVREMAEQIASAPAATVRMARSIIRHLAQPEIRASMDEEMIGQTYLSRSDDMAELRAARADERPPHYTGS